MFRIIVYFFLPALLPIIIYLVVYGVEFYNARKNNKEKPTFFNEKLYKSFALSLGIAVITFVLLFVGMSFRTIEGHQKPKVVDGKLVK